MEGTSTKDVYRKSVMNKYIESNKNLEDLILNTQINILECKQITSKNNSILRYYWQINLNFLNAQI